VRITPPVATLDAHYLSTFPAWLSGRMLAVDGTEISDTEEPCATLFEFSLVTATIQ